MSAAATLFGNFIYCRYLQLCPEENSHHVNFLCDYEHTISLKKVAIAYNIWVHIEVHDYVIYVHR